MGYVITDQNGKRVDNKTFDARANPIMNGVPSPLQYTAGASLPPGEYTLKLAIAEGDRVGTVEHTIHAGLAEAGGVTMSELARRRVDPDPRVRRSARESGSGSREVAVG